MSDDALGAAADELYGLPAAEFTAARNARAKAARSADRALAAAIAALPRPSVAAWVVNQLVRSSPADIDALLELGGRLREAHTALDADRIRTLSKERQEHIAAVLQAARDVAGELNQPVSGAVDHEIEATLGAAVATVEAGEAVRSGRLTKALSYAGFGDVEITGAVAVLRTKLRSVPDLPLADESAGEDDRAASAAADEQLEQERREQEQRRRQLGKAREASRDAEQKLAQAEALVGELEGRLEQARATVARALESVESAAQRLLDVEG